MKDKLAIIAHEYSGTTVVEGSSHLFFIFFWSTKILSFFQQRSSFLNHAIHTAVRYLPKPEFVIKNNSGTFLVKAFDDSTTICSDYFEKELRDWLNTPDTKDIFIDIGANRGIYTVLAPKNYGYTKIHAFEPNLDVVTTLEKNISLNALTNIVTVHKVALGETPGEMAFACDPMHLGGGRIAAANEVTAQVVKIEPFDNLSPAIAAARISMMKIDTEGFEFNVLSGMKKTLTTMQNGSCLMIESTEHSKLESFLREYGFSLVDSQNHDHLFKKSC